MKRPALVALAGAQFIMVLDQSVMNVSISQLVADFDTTVTTIQAVITLYCLVMAMLMLTGGKIGDIIGRRRAFVIGLVIYACGSAITAVSQSVAMLTLRLVDPRGHRRSHGAARDGRPDRRQLRGQGAQGRLRGHRWRRRSRDRHRPHPRRLGHDRAVVARCVPGRGGHRRRDPCHDPSRQGCACAQAPKPKLDIVGSVLSATGLGLVVLGVLQSTTWGLIVPKDSPITPFGLALTPFVIALGGVLLWAFVAWQRRREAAGTDPLVHLDLMKVPPLRAGLIGLFSQNLILMGVFFTIPLYLQLVLGLDALQTGVKMLPTSVAMFIAAAAGSGLATRYSVRGITRAGLTATALASVMLLATIQPDLADLAFAVSMAVLGVGMGLIASQLGLVVQSSVDASGRGEAGGLQYTGQQLGSSLGVAFIGAIVIAGLTNSFVTNIESDTRISTEVANQVGVAVETGVDFVSSTDIEAAAQAAGLDQATTDAIVDDYEAAQIRSLKAGLLVVGLLALASLAFTSQLPLKIASGDEEAEGDEPPPVPATPSMA